MSNRKKVGLALGGGSARGWAHIGVIKALNEAGIPIDYIAGTSIGSMIGGVHASGKIHELEEFALHMDWKKVLGYFDISYSRNGLIDGEKVKDTLLKQFLVSKVEKTQIPFAAVACDMEIGKEEVIKKGNMADAIRASISLPGIFTPDKHGKKYLVDGGLLNPLPISVVKNMGADVVIAVDLNYQVAGKKPAFKSKIKKSDISESTKSKLKSYKDKIEDKLTSKINKWMETKWPTIFDVLGNSINIMQQKITEENLKENPADFLIQTKLGYVRLFDFHLAEQVIDHGYKLTKKKIKDIEKAVYEK